jgi:hypothetical protein
MVVPAGQNMQWMQMYGVFIPESHQLSNNKHCLTHNITLQYNITNYVVNVIYLSIRFSPQTHTAIFTVKIFLPPYLLWNPLKNKNCRTKSREGKYTEERVQYTSMYIVIFFHSIFVFFHSTSSTSFDVFSWIFHECIAYIRPCSLLLSTPHLKLYLFVIFPTSSLYRSLLAA